MNIDSFGIRIPADIKVLTNRTEVWSKKLEIENHAKTMLGGIAQNEMDLDAEMRAFELEQIKKIESLVKEYRALIRIGLKYKDAQ